MQDEKSTTKDGSEQPLYTMTLNGEPKTIREFAIALNIPHVLTTFEFQTVLDEYIQGNVGTENKRIIKRIFGRRPWGEYKALGLRNRATESAFKKSGNSGAADMSADESDASDSEETPD